LAQVQPFGLERKGAVVFCLGCLAGELAAE